MSKIFFALLLSTAFLFQSFTSDKKIKFRENGWSEIGKAAKTEDKMIFVLVTGDYCSASRKMKRVLQDGKVGEFYNKNFVSTNFDAENFIQHYRASNWGVTSVPAMVFLDKNRKVIHKKEGFLNAEGMLKEAQEAMAKQ